MDVKKIKAEVVEVAETGQRGSAARGKSNLKKKEDTNTRMNSRLVYLVIYSYHKGMSI